MRARRYSVESIKNNTRPLQYVTIFAIVLLMAGVLFCADTRLASVQSLPASSGWPTPPSVRVYSLLNPEQKLAIQIELHGWPTLSSDQSQVIVGGRAFPIAPGHFDESPEVKTARSLTIYEELFGPASDADVRHAKAIMNQDRIDYYFGGWR